VRRPLEEYRWPILAGLALVALVLGFWGFRQHVDAVQRSIPDDLYRTLQLFTLQFNTAPPIAIQLEIGRWLAWVVTVGATIGAILAILRDHVGRLRVAFTRHHVVICGLGRCGRRLALGFRDRGYPVVVIERDPFAPGVEPARREGIIVLPGDASELSVLRRAGVGKARYLIAVCGDDGINVDVAVNAHDLLDPERSGSAGGPLDCFAYVVDPDVRQFLREFAIRTSKAQIFRLDPFDVSELGAPGILAGYPAFDQDGRTELGPPGILIVGLGQTGSRLVLGAANLWTTTPASRERLRVTIVDRDAAKLTEAMLNAYPRLDVLLDLVPVSADVDSPLFARILADVPRVREATSAYICLGEEIGGLKTALILRRTLSDPRATIVIRTTERSTLTTFPVDLESSQVNIHVFNMLDRTCTPEIILQGPNEILARAIHEEYVRTEAVKGETPLTNRSMVPWSELPAILKESNRDQAAHIGSKLREVGCDVRSVADVDPAPPVGFSPSEIERLARFEHQRWVRERLAAGFTFAPTKNIDRKQTPYLVPWEELPEETKQHDRNTVHGLPGFLAKAGYAVVRESLDPESTSSTAPGQ
jgi:voltage-gated potassium channel Kch